MYGKHFESMYDGSMYGAGLEVFAVWGYVIAHAKASRIELNPKKLSDTLGGQIEVIEKTIEFLTSPDPRSRHKDFEGRRLIKEGEFQYFVPSWESYQAIRSAEERRVYNRVKKQESRAKLLTPPKTAQPRFQKPSISDLELEGLSPHEAEKFFHHYESVGWKVGKDKPMKSWKSSVAGWKQRMGQFNNHQPPDNGRIPEFKSKEEEQKWIRDNVDC